MNTVKGNKIDLNEKNWSKSKKWSGIEKPRKNWWNELEKVELKIGMKLNGSKIERANLESKEEMTIAAWESWDFRERKWDERENW